MAPIKDSVIERANRALDVVRRRARIRGAYIFGSVVDGTADANSDIDVAVFVEEAHNLDMIQRAEAATDVQLEVGSDIEVHFYSADLLDTPPTASFAEYIQKNGVRLAVD